MKYLYNILKIVMVLALCLYVSVLFRYSSDSDIPIAKVEEAVAKTEDVSAMHRADALELKKLYGLDDGNYEDFILYVSDDSMDVRELLLIRTENDSQREAVEKAVADRLDIQKQNFEGYGIEQMKLLSDREILVRGNYIFFAVSKEAESMKQAFAESLLRQ